MDQLATRSTILALAFALTFVGSLAQASSLNDDVAQMDRMISEARAGAVFHNETTKAGDLVALHEPSGMRCHFIRPGKLIYDPSSSGAVCLIPRTTYVLSLAAAPAAGSTIDAVLAAAVSGVAKDQTPKEQPLSDFDVKLLADPKLPHSVARRFEVGGKFWFVSVARTGDWFVVMEAISQLRGDLMGQVEQDLEWRDVLEKLKTS